MPYGVIDMKAFLKDDRGSFTFEATLVFPAFLMFILACIFFCIMIFHMAIAHYTAQKAASQTAYTWNNSKKDLETGEFSKEQYPGLDDKSDGLYWRVFDNGILDIFGLESELFSSQFSSLKDDKIAKAEKFYKQPLNVEVNYKNHLIYSEVEVTAKSGLYVPSFLQNMMGKSNMSIEATTTHVVTETPELVRTFNFAKYIWNASGLGKVTKNIKDSIDKFFD